MAGRKVKKTAPVTLATEDALSEWAEDEGWLDDSVLFATRAVGKSLHLVMGLRLLEAAQDPRKNFNRTSERYYEFTLVADDAVRSPTPAGAPPLGRFEIVGFAPRRAGRFGLVMNLGDKRLTVVAKRFRVLEHGEVRKPMTPAFGPDLCFHGPGPVTVREIRDAIAAAGAKVDLYRNWKGSGQSYGSAFVNDKQPKRITRGLLDEAMRVVAQGASAKNRRGLWLAGQSLPSFAYVNVEASETTDAELLAAVVRGLATLPAFTWASSGSRLVESVAEREEWLGSRHASATPPRVVP
jgi:hypothetical protein